MNELTQKIRNAQILAGEDAVIEGLKEKGLFNKKDEPPIYKVIGDYPDNKDFPVGKIIEFEKWNEYYWQHKIIDCQGERTWLSEYFDKYPHLFKRVW